MAFVLSGWCCYLFLSSHGTWLSEVRYNIFHFRGCFDCERNLVIPRLVGSNSSSWGWCLKTLKVYHDSRKYRHGVSYPRYYKYQRNQIEQHRFWSHIYTMTLRKLKTCTRDVDEKLRVPETFYMLLDMDRGTLAFQVIFENIMIFQGRDFSIANNIIIINIFCNVTTMAFTR